MLIKIKFTFWLIILLITIVKIIMVKELINKNYLKVGINKSIFQQ